MSVGVVGLMIGSGGGYANAPVRGGVGGLMGRGSEDTKLFCSDVGLPEGKAGVFA